MTPSTETTTPHPARIDTGPGARTAVRPHLRPAESLTRGTAEQPSPSGAGRTTQGAGPIIPAELLAERLTAIVARRAELSVKLDFRLTNRRAFILLLAYAAPVGVSELRTGVAALVGTRWHPPLRRLIHRRLASGEMRRLDDFGVLSRLQRGNRVLYQLQPHARDALAVETIEPDACLVSPT